MEVKTRLTEVLPGKVLLKTDDQYAASNNTYFTVFESDLKPAFIAQPTNAAEVGSLLKSLKPLLEQQNISVAIRGTGHTPFAGSANVADGVTVDMRGLKGITLSEDKSSVDIGVGENWASVYNELEKHGLTTAGGRVGRVGVGGLVLGGILNRPNLLKTLNNHVGGLSFYSTRRGFACDSVVEFEVVLASGDIVRANNEENHDLWIALRGGLNNFGIVTSFKMKTFESGKLWGGVAYYMPDSFTQLAEATVNFVGNESDEDTHIMSSAGYGFGHRVVTCCMYHTKEVENPLALQPFTSLPGRIEQHGSLRIGTHMEFCDELSSFTQDGVRCVEDGIASLNVMLMV
jgi:FAD/FMN-containing dehydrogenase